MPQNLLDIGINLAELENQKQQALAIVADFYAKLNTFEGNKVNVIGITGLTELNAATKANQTSTEQLNTSIANLGITLKTYNQLADQNVTLSAKLYESNTAEAKTNADLKVALQEKNRELINSARLENEDYQARILSIDVARKQALVEKQAALDIVNANREKIKVEREAIELGNQLDKQAAKEAKNQLLLTNEYKQLQLALKNAEAEYAKLSLAKGPKSIESQAALNEVSAINSTITNIDKGLESAGANGATTFARSLTSGLSTLRTIAYILPGIGIAGIFNLAYEGIIKAFDALNEYNSVLHDEIKFEEQLEEILVKINQSYVEQIKNRSIFNTLSESHYEKEQLSVIEAQGENYYEINTQKQKINEIDKKSAEYLLTQFTGIKNVNQAYTQQLVNVDKLQGKLNLLNKEQSEDLSKLTIGTNDTYYKTRTDDRAKLITQIQNDYKAQKQLLDDFDNSREKSETNVAERIKFLSDEERKQKIDSVKNAAGEIINQNNIILSSEVSTQEQRLSSVKDLFTQQAIIAKATLNDIVKNNSSTPIQKQIALSDYYSELEKLTDDENKRLDDINLQYYQRNTSALTKQSDDELEIQIGKNKVIYSDDSKSYDERLKALTEYISIKNSKVEIDYFHDLNVAKRTGKTQEEIDAITTGKNKSQSDIANETQQDVYSVIQSWYQKQLKLAKETQEKNNDETVIAETKSLITLNNSFDKKLIGYRKYEEKKREIQQQFLLQGDLETLQNDTLYLNTLNQLSDSISLKILAAKEKLADAKTPEDTAKSAKELQALIEDKKNINNQIGDQNSKVLSDQLKYQEDKNKLELDGRKQMLSNYIELERDFFKDLKEVVDAEYEYRINQIEKQTEAFNQQIDNEKEAINRSTLNTKDKNAYEVQLTAQKTAADLSAAQKERKIKHDEAVFNRDVDIAQIILNTEVAITQALRIPVIGEALALSYGVLGAAALATALAVKIPSYAFGGTHLGGLARFGEAGNELVKEPGKQPYMARRETVAYLPKGTDLIPMYETPTLSTNYKDDSWKQTKYLAAVIKKGNKRIDNTIHNHIKIDLGYTTYKNNILHG